MYRSKRSDLGLSQNLESLNPIHININHKIWCFVVAFFPLKLPSLQSPFGPNILTHPDRMSSALWLHCPTVGASGFSKIRAFSELSLLLHVFSFTTWMMVDKTTTFQTFFPDIAMDSPLLGCQRAGFFRCEKTVGTRCQVWRGTKKTPRPMGFGPVLQKLLGLWWIYDWHIELVGGCKIEKPSQRFQDKESQSGIEGEAASRGTEMTQVFCWDLVAWWGDLAILCQFWSLCRIMRAFMMQILGVRFELGVKLALRWEWRSLDLFEIRSKNGKEPSLPPGGPGLLRCAIWYRKPVIAEITPLELCRQSDAQRRASIIPSVAWSPPGLQAIPGGPGRCFGCGWFTPSRMMICSTFSKVQSPKWPSRGKGGALHVVLNSLGYLLLVVEVHVGQLYYMMFIIFCSII